MASAEPRPLAIVSGFDLLIAADEPEIGKAAETLRAQGAGVEAVQADLSRHSSPMPATASWTRISPRGHQGRPAEEGRSGRCREERLRGHGEGQRGVVSGWKNKLQSAAAVTPAGMLAGWHRKMAEPGSGKE